MTQIHKVYLMQPHSGTFGIISFISNEPYFGAEVKWSFSNRIKFRKLCQTPSFQRNYAMLSLVYVVCSVQVRHYRGTFDSKILSSSPDVRNKARGVYEECREGEKETQRNGVLYQSVYVCVSGWNALCLQTDGFHIPSSSCLFIWRKSGRGHRGGLLRGRGRKMKGGGSMEEGSYILPLQLVPSSPTSKPSAQKQKVPFLVMTQP